MNWINTLIILFVSFLALINVLPYYFISGEIDKEFKRKIYIVYTLVILFLTGLISKNLYSVAFALFYFLIFRYKLKKKKHIALFLAFYISLAFEAFRYFINSVFFKLIDIKQLGMFQNAVYYTILYLLIIYLHRILFEYMNYDFVLLEGSDFRRVVGRSNTIFGSLLLFKIVLSILATYRIPFETQFDTTLSLVIMIFYIGTLVYIKTAEERYLTHKDIREKEEEIRNLNQFVDKLGNLYDQIRGFRHDFAGIVSSLGPAIKDQDMEAIQKVYNKALVKTNSQLQIEDYRFFDLKNVEDLAIRGALANHILRAEDEKVDLHLEIKDHIPTVDVPMLPVIRMTNIILNNALEAAKEAAVSQVNIALISSESETLFIVSNTRKEADIDQRKIWERGYSSKGNNRGLGLANLLDMVHEYENVELNTEVDVDIFTQTLTFKSEGSH